MTKNIHELYIEMHEATEAELNLAHGTEGWSYRDISWMSTKHIDQLIDIIGSENLKWGSFSTRHDWDNGPHHRGMSLISPAGMENLKAYNKEVENKNA